jgi:uncharacterized protein
MKRHPLLAFWVWLVCFYATWLGLVVYGDYWRQLSDHWAIALTMLFGSYVAGSTPMGGGTVGFPVLVLLFDMPGSLGRNFGLAIQSIGMVSASIYILCERRPLALPMLRPAMWGALVGTPFGACFIAPGMDDLVVKLVFAILWASFGILLCLKQKEMLANQAIVSGREPWHTLIGLLVGVLGGIVASITGVGIDMAIFVVLVLLDRADLKIAIPTSVILMAFTSVVGLLSNVLLAATGNPLYAMDPEVFYSWLAAAPVVALGAPLGAFVVQLIPRGPTLIFVALLCIAQFAWTLWQESVSPSATLIAVLSVGISVLLFLRLNTLGHGLQARRNDD